MTPLERARGVMARYRAGDPDKTPPLVRLIAEAIEAAVIDAAAAGTNERLADEAKQPRTEKKLAPAQ